MSTKHIGQCKLVAYFFYQSVLHQDHHTPLLKHGYKAGVFTGRTRGGINQLCQFTVIKYRPPSMCFSHLTNQTFCPLPNKADRS